MDRAAEGVHPHGLSGELPRGAGFVTRRVSLKGLSRIAHYPQPTRLFPDRPSSRLRDLNETYPPSARLAHWIGALGFVCIWGCGHAMTTMVEEDSPLEEFLFDLQIPCRPTVCERSTGCTTETGKPADQNRSKVFVTIPGGRGVDPVAVTFGA